MRMGPYDAPSPPPTSSPGNHREGEFLRAESTQSSCWEAREHSEQADLLRSDSFSEDPAMLGHYLLGPDTAVYRGGGVCLIRDPEQG